MWYVFLWFKHNVIYENANNRKCEGHCCSGNFVISNVFDPYIDILGKPSFQFDI